MTCEFGVNHATYFKLFCMWQQQRNSASQLGKISYTMWVLQTQSLKKKAGIFILFFWRGSKSKE